MSKVNLQDVWVAYAGWIRHIDAHLEKADEAFRRADDLLINAANLPREDQEGRNKAMHSYGTNLGTAHGEVISAREDLANALSRGFTLPSDS